MEQSYGIKYLELEETHWWFSGRRDMIYKLIQDCKRSSDILEIGCSGGPLLNFLKKKGFVNIKGIDVSKAAVDVCRQKGIDGVNVADGCNTGLANRQFDVIIASDVLEHIRDEGRALSEWHRLLKPDGKLIVFVPAFKFLWSRHDEVNLHFRRYRAKELIEVLKKNKFIVERISFWNFGLFFPAAAVRFFQKIFHSGRKNDGQLRKTNPVLNNIFEYILKKENGLLSKGLNFPVGVSLFAIAGKT